VVGVRSLGRRLKVNLGGLAVGVSLKGFSIGLAGVTTGGLGIGEQKRSAGRLQWPIRS
jgi:hypothetical protein